jgi:hypothetical protein
LSYVGPDGASVLLVHPGDYDDFEDNMKAVFGDTSPPEDLPLPSLEHLEGVLNDWYPGDDKDPP